jgi:CheY-like chemotaxis protein
MLMLRWILVACLVAPSVAVADTLPDDNAVQIHGFVSQGALLTTDHNYLANTERGSLAFSEAGINFTKQLDDDLSVGVQINNPLMAVLGNLDTAAGDVRRLSRQHPSSTGLAEVAEELRDAREAGERVRNIVRDLKLFSHSDEETRGDVRVEQALESSLRMVWNEVRHRAMLVRDYKDVPPVYANESRLGQVFLNLIVNAAQAIPEGRANQNQIRVATSLAADGRVRVDISDTGTGMQPEVVAQLFTPFFTIKPIGVGTGLGLSICHQLVTAIGGEISVETEAGRGTTFTVLLPALAATPVVPRTVTAHEPPPTRRSRVQLIDDEPMVAKTFSRALGRRHDVVTKEPTDAIRAIEHGETFDVIFCDLMMPNVSGMDVYGGFERISPEQATRMVFITGGAFTVARAFLEQTKNRQLEKPIDLDELRAFVDATVRTLDEEHTS